MNKLINNVHIYRIWDKIVVGARKILVFVAVIVLTTLKRCLMKCENIEQVLEAINSVCCILFK